MDYFKESETVSCPTCGRLRVGRGPTSEFYDLPDYYTVIEFMPKYHYQALIWYNGGSWQIQENALTPPRRADVHRARLVF